MQIDGNHMHPDSSTKGRSGWREPAFVLRKGQMRMWLGAFVLEDIESMHEVFAMYSDKIVARTVCEQRWFNEEVNIASRKYPPKYNKS